MIIDNKTTKYNIFIKLKNAILQCPLLNYLIKLYYMMLCNIIRNSVDTNGLNVLLIQLIFSLIIQTNSYRYTKLY